MVLGSGIRDPGSGKNLFRIPDPGVKKAPDPGSGSATLATASREFLHEPQSLENHRRVPANSPYLFFSVQEERFVNQCA